MAKRKPLYPHVPKGTVPRGVYRAVSPQEIEREKLVERAMGYRAFSLREVEPIIGNLEVAMARCHDAADELEELERSAPDPSVRLTVKQMADKARDLGHKIGEFYEESKFLVRR